MRGTVVAYDQISDLEIIQRILAGDDQAISFLLIDKCGSRLKFLCTYKFKALGIEFHELVSETYTLLQNNQWKALRDFRGENDSGQVCKLENYISVIVSRHLLRKMDKTLKEMDSNRPLFELEHDSVHAVRYDQTQLSQDVMDAVMALENPRERAVISLYKLGGHSAEEVAALLGTTPANLYTICNRAMAHLREILVERGIYG